MYSVVLFLIIVVCIVHATNVYSRDGNLGLLVSPPLQWNDCNEISSDSCSQRMNNTDFGDILTFRVAPP